MNKRPRRSVLYMPEANERALEKAKTLPADALILDLEDGVASRPRPKRGERAIADVKSGGYGRRELIIRGNAIGTPCGTEDLKATAAARTDAMLVPKVSRPADMVSATKLLNSQIEPCNQIFLPSDEEVAWSCKVIQAFAMPEHKGKPVTSVNGRVVERLHLVVAACVVAIWEATAR
jgi:citrate lyase beta subunit